MIWIEIISHFDPEGFEATTKIIERFVARAVRLYEQGQGESFGSPLLGPYVKRWVRWLYGHTPCNGD